MYAIGKGGFGRVWKVMHKKTKKIFAMKEMSKAKIYIRKSINSISKEREFLSKLNYPFLSNMHYAFQTQTHLYIILDYLSGGDLRYHICKKNIFSEKETKFLISNIILSLEYIHSNHIIHRDIKPENLVFDSKGYLHLTDFGIASEHYEKDILINSSGTPGYMAPEVLIKKPHSFEVDFYALGIIIFELVYGKRPYNGKTRKEIRDQVISREVKLKNCNLPLNWDENLIDFINGLLKRKIKNRLGHNGISEIKNHPFLNDVNWEEIEKMNLQSPFIFYGEDNFDKSYANKKDEEYDELKIEEYVKLINDSNVYCNFYYNEGKCNVKKLKDSNLNNNYEGISGRSTSKQSNNLNKSFEKKSENKEKESNISKLNFGKKFSMDINNNGSFSERNIYFKRKKSRSKNEKDDNDDQTELNVNVEPVILKMKSSKINNE